MLYPDTTVINNEAISQLFVAYKFLNCDPAELETPVSLPKPAPNRPIHYNFKKGEKNKKTFVLLMGVSSAHERNKIQQVSLSKYPSYFFSFSR